MAAAAEERSVDVVSRFVAIGDALSSSEIAPLNAWCDRTQQSNRAQWGVAERGATAE
eukprot:COSAG04_NODE_24646_length_319_cov_0.386364_1_plen_56_part_01